MQIINKLLRSQNVYIFFISFALFKIIFSTTYLQANNLTYGATGEYLQVSIDKTGTSNDFLSDLIKEGFTVKYYRNISKSTKRLFNQ